LRSEEKFVTSVKRLSERRNGAEMRGPLYDTSHRDVDLLFPNFW
jgi:hypothetical protein